MAAADRIKSTLSWSPTDLPTATELSSKPEPGHVHLVGIGGIGVSGIAEVLLTMGYRVSGSDLGESESTRRLASLGARILVGHDEAHVGDDTDVVVISSAVGDENPEVRCARSRHIPVIPRAEMLAELMRAKCGVAVAGAHGKTTTTSLVASVLAEGGLDPTVVIGGRLKSLGGTNARLGRSRYMVAEADESDGSFLLIKPTVAVVTNIDREHMNFYRDMDTLLAAYESYINGIPFYGRAWLCADCERVRGLLGRLRKRHATYGTVEDAELRADAIEQDGLNSRFDVSLHGERLGRIELSMPGRHAVLNGLAAVGVGLEFGLDFETVASALSQFDGILRRFEVKGERAGVLVVDDYGHHPTEIRAVLAAAAGFDRRVVAVFQPHRYSRLADLFDDFVACFDDADRVVVTDVYAAGENPLDGYDAPRFAAELEARGRAEVVYVERGDVAERVADEARDGDLVLTLGAGDITRVGAEILERLAK